LFVLQIYIVQMSVKQEMRFTKKAAQIKFVLLWL